MHKDDKEEWTETDWLNLLKEAQKMLDEGWRPGDEEEEDPAVLKAEAERALAIADLLRRHDAGSLESLLKRWANKERK